MRLRPGEEFVLAAPLKARCCNYTIPIGTRLVVRKVPSPNRAELEMLTVTPGSIHKVKSSNIRKAS